MLTLVLALAISLPQEPAVLDAPAWRDLQWGVDLPRPFADWVFAPATERGTTTVIFQPRAGALSDQLWGVLILTPWGQPVPLSDLADRRIADTWRPALGSSFRLVARDSTTIDGLPAIHALMSGSLSLAVVDVEEYLIARGTDLLVLQFRYPRGVPRDSIAAGYARTLSGLRLTPSAIAAAIPAAPATSSAAPAGRAPAPPASAPAGRTTWDTRIDRDQVVFTLPAELRAIAPGWLSAEVVANGRRTMRWTAALGEPDTTLYAVGHFTPDVRRVGRLTIRIWRSGTSDASIARVSDSLIARVARAWASYWHAFGPVPTTELTLVETAWPETHGAAAILYLGADVADPYAVRRELARTWWGAAVESDASTGSLVRAALPEWAAAQLGDGRTSAAQPNTSNALTLENVRRTAGDARFRDALRTFINESRSRPPAVPDLLTVLGDSASGLLRPLLRTR